ncbi:response regulator [Aliarcobacter butzleri]|uniref:Two-component system response regulator n=1 Tax=Arcobacter lacus TaxID=1912876 RepID=A0ABX5JGK3_9BACT|nr:MULTISPECIES: response regulator [Arcobacteraceae]MDK2091585.1 response regulator [Aliarcobacter butzleri]PUE66258.1 hypothetical protein B0175_05995 [Arcobacter lacus]
MKFENYNILIVEDEIIASEYLKNILISLNFKNIFEAKNSQGCLESVKNNKIDLILMDINIEGNLDGIKLAKLINKNSFIPIVYTTAYADADTINEAKESNVFGYLVKPFSSQEVEATINVAIKILSRFNEKTNKSIDDKSSIVRINEDYSYNFDTKTLTRNGKVFDLTKKELVLLDFFCHNLNQNVSYDVMREYIWHSTNVSSSTIRDIVSRLKNKVPNLNIENIVNYGYILKTN